TVEILLVFGLIEILCDESLGFEVYRDVPNLAAFAMDAKVQHAFALLKIAHLELAEFLPTQTVIQQCGEDRAVTFALEGVCRRCFEEHTGLLVTEYRREAFAGVSHFRSLHAFHRIMPHDDVYRLKADCPTLHIEINGGITTLLQATAHLQYVDGAML